MKISSSFMEQFHLKKGELHTISFESSHMLKQFRESINNFFNHKNQSMNQFLHVLDQSNEMIKSRDTYFITFDCNVVNLKEEKITTKYLQELLLHQLENNPILIEEYVRFNEYLDNFVNHIELVNGQLSIEFELGEKSISQFIKSLDIKLEYNEEDYIPNYIMRKNLIEVLLKMNQREKEVFLLISYPETDIGSEDFKASIQILEQLQVTTLIITSQLEILRGSKDENMLLVNKNGNFYDIVRLRKELLSFQLVDDGKASTLAKILAYKDFTKDYYLLDHKMKEFLLSNTF